MCHFDLKNSHPYKLPSLAAATSINCLLAYVNTTLHTLPVSIKPHFSWQSLKGKNASNSDTDSHYCTRLGHLGQIEMILIAKASKEGRSYHQSNCNLLSFCCVFTVNISPVWTDLKGILILRVIFVVMIILPAIIVMFWKGSFWCCGILVSWHCSFLRD
jgi:hypothetical protein